MSGDVPYPPPHSPYLLSPNFVQPGCITIKCHLNHNLLWTNFILSDIRKIWGKKIVQSIPEAPTTHHLYKYLSTLSYLYVFWGWGCNDALDNRSMKAKGLCPGWHPGLLSLMTGSGQYMNACLQFHYAHMEPLWWPSWTTLPKWNPWDMWYITQHTNDISRSDPASSRILCISLAFFIEGGLAGSWWCGLYFWFRYSWSLIIWLLQLCLIKSSACSKSWWDANGAQGWWFVGEGSGFRLSDKAAVSMISGGCSAWGW